MTLVKHDEIICNNPSSKGHTMNLFSMKEHIRSQQMWGKIKQKTYIFNEDLRNWFCGTNEEIFNFLGEHNVIDTNCYPHQRRGDSMLLFLYRKNEAKQFIKRLNAFVKAHPEFLTLAVRKDVDAIGTTYEYINSAIANMEEAIKILEQEKIIDPSLGNLHEIKAALERL